jgi:hypothetical protein
MAMGRASVASLAVSQSCTEKMTFEMIGASQIGEITSSQCSLRACSRIEVAPRPEDQTGVFAILVYKL